jgi:hypothetical protein
MPMVPHNTTSNIVDLAEHTGPAPAPSTFASQWIECAIPTFAVGSRCKKRTKVASSGAIGFAITEAKGAKDDLCHSFHRA